MPAMMINPLTKLNGRAGMIVGFGLRIAVVVAVVLVVSLAGRGG